MATVSSPVCRSYTLAVQSVPPVARYLSKPCDVNLGKEQLMMSDACRQAERRVQHHMAIGQLLVSVIIMIYITYSSVTHLPVGSKSNAMRWFVSDGLANEVTGSDGCRTSQHSTAESTRPPLNSLTPSACHLRHVMPPIASWYKLAVCSSNVGKQHERLRHKTYTHSD